MNEILQIVFKISLVLFMVGNLLDMGLRLKVREAFAVLKNVRFVALSVVWGFILSPALAYLLAKLIPLQEPYAIGLILLGLTPCAPFLPMMVDKARGELAYAAAFMLLASVITVVYMPFMVPAMIQGFTADAWTIAKPLLLFLIVPLAIGTAIQRAWATAASSLQPFVKKITGIDTVLMLVLCIPLYGKGFVGAVGSYAIGTQVLFFLVVTCAPYVLSFGLPQGQKSVLSLGMSTRNLGAAFAPLVAFPDIDQRAIVMVALAAPMQVIFSLLAANRYGRLAAPDGEPTVRRKDDFQSREHEPAEAAERKLAR